MGYLTTVQPIDHGVVSGLVGALTARYPFLCAAPIGRSVMGRSLWGMTLGSGKHRVLMAAAFHGQEWLTALVCLRLCEELCRSLAEECYLAEWDIRRAMSGRSVVFVPMVNPDGVEIALRGSEAAGDNRDAVRSAGGDIHGHWQANANGVDINHNFNAGWKELQQAEQKKGIKGFSARQWGGPCPESEPETRALIGLCERASFRHVVALHSQGEEIYWQYGDNTPPCSELMARVMAAASGYTVSSPEGLASHGGFKDWFISTYSRPGFTIELGKGINPLPLSDFKKIYEKAREMLLVSLFL
ncbi:MAG: M14 family metallocarboxypeptidase [Clostridia bacterium]|nr:M14 family metallocarboxypeptidase [Clostridia bacterium]